MTEQGKNASAVAEAQERSATVPVGDAVLTPQVHLRTVRLRSSWGEKGEAARILQDAMGLVEKRLAESGVRWSSVELHRAQLVIRPTRLRPEEVTRELAQALFKLIASHHESKKGGQEHA